ncbi:hypothetical protein Hanom_Chr14g01281521 [Helianthus anomalus]
MGSFSFDGLDSWTSQVQQHHLSILLFQKVNRFRHMRLQNHNTTCKEHKHADVAHVKLTIQDVRTV